MENVVENYKLIEVEVDGEVHVVKVNTSDAWNVIEVQVGETKVTVNENDKIKFVTESGEPKSGVLVKITGKGEKTKIKFIPTDSECEEIWSVMSIKEGSLKVINDKEVK